MDWNAGAAVGAGLVATAVMTAIMYMGLGLMPRQMSMNILHMMGTMMSRSTMPIYVIGAMMHFGLGILFALAHTGLYTAFNLETALVGWGLLFGLVHWLIVGMGFGMIGSMHPRMRSGEMSAPGPFLRNFPTMTIMGFLMVHLVYGLVVGALYEVWA